MAKLLWSHGQQGINVKYVVLITPLDDMPLFYMTRESVGRVGRKPSTTMTTCCS